MSQIKAWEFILVVSIVAIVGFIIGLDIGYSDEIPNKPVLIEIMSYDTSGQDNAVRVARYLFPDGTVKEISAYTMDGLIIVKEYFND